MSPETSNRLPILAAEIRVAHSDIQEAAKTAAQRAIDAGHLLIEAKELVKHGEWLPWLKQHCALAERTAQLYMKIAKSGHTPDTVATLGLKAAEKALTLKYCFYQPLFDGDESQQREWRLFALYLIKVAGFSPEGIGEHIDWIGRKDFKTPDEWLTEGPPMFRRWKGQCATNAELKGDEERLALWHSFRSEHGDWTTDQVDREMENADRERPPQKKKKRRRRKSATVADLGAPS